MKQIQNIIFVFAILLIAQSIFGQGPDTPLPSTVNPSSLIVPAPDLRIMDPDINKSLDGKGRNRILIEEELLNKSLNKQPDPDANKKQRLFALDTRRIQVFRLNVPQTYYDKYNAILKDKSTHLAKIIANKCNDGNTVSVQDVERCKDAPQIWGGGSYYSFRNDTNFNAEFGNWADINAYDNKFVVGSLSVQGIISIIGDVDIAGINLKSPELKFLTQYSPKKHLAEFKSEKKLLESGIKANGFIYSTSAPIKLNSTYVLRSIAYHLEKNEMADNRISIIVAFRVIGVEKDGSLILLWKELKTDKSPSLKA